MAKRFTLFHLDSERGFRGGERQLLYLAAHLRARGHENVVVCRGREALEAEARRQRFRTMRLPFLGEWDPVSAWRLRRASRSARHAPVLHAHTAHAAALAYLASRFGGPPWVAHRRVDFHLNGSLSRRLKYDTAPRVIAVSESIRRILVADGMEGSRITVVPDCIPLTDDEARLAGLDAGPMRRATRSETAAIRRPLAENLGLPETGPWIGNLAAHVPHKDQATLIRSLPSVLKALPKARLLLVGDGPLRTELEALARSLGVESAVRFAGHQSDPAPWLSCLDVYVQSSWGEGMGSVLLEAMACGVPIVATTAGGIPEVIEHGRSGLLVPPRDPERMAGAIVDSLLDPESARRRADAAAEDLKSFGLSRVGDRMIALYREVTE
ncbi:MAG: glycosyltransferase [Elusimicrobiota bacterium]